MMRRIQFWQRLWEDFARKNFPEIQGLLLRRYPGFVWGNDRPLANPQAPVFAFHRVDPDVFERQLQFLAENGYRSLDADTFLACLEGRLPWPERAVLLTFDDGRASLWTVAYPLLKRYGFVGVAFLPAGLIHQEESVGPNLEDVSRGRVSLEEVLAREEGDRPFVTWGEVRRMAAAGVLEPQSHGTYHHLVFRSDALEDFLHPGTPLHAEGTRIPRFRGLWDAAGQIRWGLPLYPGAPRLSEARAYVPDARVVERCTRTVAEEGGEAFFQRPGWRKRLYRQWRPEGRYESEAERRKGLLEELALSREIIQGAVPGARVRHLCYPYYQGSRLAMEISRTVGYKSNFWGVLDRRAWGSAYRIPRLGDMYLWRLPGRGRVPLRTLLLRHAQVHGPKLLARLRGA